jgi:hypothetical protein
VRKKIGSQFRLKRECGAHGSGRDEAEAKIPRLSVSSERHKRVFHQVVLRIITKRQANKLAMHQARIQQKSKSCRRASVNRLIIPVQETGGASKVMHMRLCPCRASVCVDIHVYDASTTVSPDAFIFCA